MTIATAFTTDAELVATASADALQAGRLPEAPLAMPKNASTGRLYSGINVLILWGSVIEHGFPVQAWLTSRLVVASPAITLAFGLPTVYSV